jgi:hypothetical protein
MILTIAMKKPLKSLALWKSEYLESNPEMDPELFARQVGSGSKTRAKWDLVPDPDKKNSFGSTTLVCSRVVT